MSFGLPANARNRACCPRECPEGLIESSTPSEGDKTGAKYDNKRSISWPCALVRERYENVLSNPVAIASRAVSAACDAK